MSPAPRSARNYGLLVTGIAIFLEFVALTIGYASSGRFGGLALPQTPAFIFVTLLGLLGTGTLITESSSRRHPVRAEIQAGLALLVILVGGLGGMSLRYLDASVLISFSAAILAHIAMPILWALSIAGISDHAATIWTRRVGWLLAVAVGTLSISLTWRDLSTFSEDDYSRALWDWAHPEFARVLFELHQMLYVGILVASAATSLVWWGSSQRIILNWLFLLWVCLWPIQTFAQFWSCWKHPLSELGTLWDFFGSQGVGFAFTICSFMLGLATSKWIRMSTPTRPRDQHRDACGLIKVSELLKAKTTRTRCASTVASRCSVFPH